MSLNQLSMLLGLPDSDCKQILDYGATLSKAEAADHFKNLLGDSPQAIEFISSFNSRRQDPKPAPAPAPAPAPTPAPAPASVTQQQGPSDLHAVPKKQWAPKKKKKAPLGTPAARQITDATPASGTVYSKKSIEDDYISSRSGPSTTPSNSNSPFTAPPPKSSTPPPPKKFSKQPPSAAGSLVSDRLAPPKQKPKSNPTSRSSTPGPAASKGNGGTVTKVSIAGGTPMHGASTAVADLDAAIRSLEVTTNPSLSGGGGGSVSARRCNCVASRHPLQSAAPNCLSCGKVICLKEGLGPCTFCGTPLLSSGEVQSMIQELRAERGREKQAADRQAHRRADVSATPRPFTKPRTGVDESSGGGLGEAEARALEHRDRLLGFQAQNARRTTVRDEAADFDVSGAMAGFGGSLWASPEDRARELKRQQKVLREMEWNARPDYEKRQQVVSIDLVGGKVVKKFVAKERPATPDEEREDEPLGTGAAAGGGVLEETSANRRPGAGGAFSRNPLLGGMIKPVYDAKGKGVALEGRKDKAATRWRRVQDDLDDNEAIILDGGVYGGQQGAKTGTAGDEPDCG
ncbi:hypothetical protein DHEL01_v206739 [Diaporthe helianthi]|uniref:TRIP4/RQT4 C2HC5-type zinc finger domain-containing protein n=1 Tax=Diaporthe helianthi TaxID=158607 RepID=A0A2P5HX77_DIAHE|nr:hypothetical protein DHEL01_v206739 [Diaporthe helianthi]